MEQKTFDEAFKLGCMQGSVKHGGENVIFRSMAKNRNGKN